MRELGNSSRLHSLTRFFLEVRLLLIGILLLFIPPERLTPEIFLTAGSSALLTWLAVRNWDKISASIAQHPLFCVADAAIVSALLVFDGPTGPLFMATLATAAIAGAILTVRSVIAVGFVQITCYFAASLYYTTTHDSIDSFLTFQSAIAQPVLYPMVTIGGRRLRGILTELASEQDARKRAERRATIAEERARLARELHDSVTKTLRGAAMSAQALPRWVQKDSTRAVTSAEQIVSAIETAHKETRELLDDLREDDVSSSLVDRLTNIVDQWSDRVSIPASVLPPDQDIHLMFSAKHELISVLQESLSNIEKHAGATSVRVELSTDGDSATLSVADNGQGFETRAPASDTSTSGSARHGHYGLRGIQERTASIGGQVTIISAPGSGTRVELSVPLATPANDSTVGRDYVPIDDTAQTERM